jgi:RNA polymerase sigma-70 factor, ECF subfamily
MRQSWKDMECWLPAARAGSREALGQALEVCRGYLLLIARRELDPQLRAKGGASDLVQEVFLEAQRDFDHFRGDSEAELRAWLRRLLLRNLTDFTRRYRGTGKRCVAHEVALEADGGPAAGLATDTLSPSGQAIAGERARSLQRALERLPEDYRRVLLWRHQERRSFVAIARLMARSPEAVRKLWGRAVERLRDELGGDL